jgi:hypothetical protein
VAEKPDFRAIKRKSSAESDFAKKRDSNPVPHGEVAADIAKTIAKKIRKTPMTILSQVIPYIPGDQIWRIFAMWVIFTYVEHFLK